MSKVSAQVGTNWQWLALTAIFAIYLALAYLIPPGADTLWRLHIAQGLLDGQTLYRDMIEVNPPLWFWGAIPAAYLGGYAALVAINLLVTSIGLLLFGFLLRLTQDEWGHWAGVLALAAGLLLVNVAEIGQREQAFLLACALWAALATARIDGKYVPIWLAISVSIIAAYGFALKHYFVLVPVVVEGLILWHKRRNWHPVRPETLLLGSLALAYGLAVVYLTPDFLGRVLGLVQTSYYGFGPWNAFGPIERQVRLLLQCAYVLVPIIVPVIALAWARNLSTFLKAFVIALAVSIAIIILQQKGWRYHIIAANGLSLVILAMSWKSLSSMKSNRLVKWFVPLGLLSILLTSFVVPAISGIKTNGQPLEPVLIELIDAEPRQNHIAVLSTAPDNAFFPLARLKRPHWSRHYSMWMMPGLLTPQSNPKKDAARQQEQVRVLAEFTSDLMCKPPNLIVGEAGYFRNPDPILFDAMAFLRADQSFARWIDAHYLRGPDVGLFPIWRLKAAKPAPTNCT